MKSNPKPRKKSSKPAMIDQSKPRKEEEAKQPAQNIMTSREDKIRSLAQQMDAFAFQYENTMLTGADLEVIRNTMIQLFEVVGAPPFIMAEPMAVVFDFTPGKVHVSFKGGDLGVYAIPERREYDTEPNPEPLIGTWTFQYKAITDANVPQQNEGDNSMTNELTDQQKSCLEEIEYLVQGYMDALGKRVVTDADLDGLSWTIREISKRMPDCYGTETGLVGLKLDVRRDPDGKVEVAVGGKMSKFMKSIHRVFDYAPKGVPVDAPATQDAIPSGNCLQKSLRECQCKQEQSEDKSVEITRAACLVAECGVELRAPSVYPDGHRPLILPEDVASFKEDPDAWYAKLEGVTKERFLDFMSWYYEESRECRCVENGRTCGRFTESTCGRAKDFVPGCTDYCHLHRHPAADAFASKCHWSKS